MLMRRPNLYIIAGPNGAGKTTASFNLLPDVLHCPNFVNADEIARGLSPFVPELVSFQAGRIMLQRIEELLPQRVDFAVETTLATRSYVSLVRRAQALGYKVHLIFFFLENEEQAVKRVAQICLSVMMCWCITMLMVRLSWSPKKHTPKAVYKCRSPKCGTNY